MLAYTYISLGKFGLSTSQRSDCRACGKYTRREKKFRLFLSLFFCDSGGIRTHDPQLRRLLLYPTELRNHRHRVPYGRKMLRKGNQKLTIHNPFAENSLIEVVKSVRFAVNVCENLKKNRYYGR